MQYKKCVIALYIRLSIEDRDVKMNDFKSESDSVANQKQMLYDFIRNSSEFQDATIIEYKDDGYSGTNFDRPQFQELLKAVRCGQIDVIIVKDFSRLGRDYLDAGNFLDKIFPAYGARFIAINDSYDSNSHIGQTSGLGVSCRNVMNELYSTDLSKKNKTAINTRMKRGEYSFPYAPYGYEKDPNDRYNVIIDEEAAEVVRRIFQYSIEGKTTRQIATILNEEQIPSPIEHKKKKGITLNGVICNGKALWNYSKITVMLKDERYTGKLVCHKHESKLIGSKKAEPVPEEEWIIIDDHHEAIISQETYDQAREATSQRANRPGKKKPIKRNNLFTCPYCNHKLMFSAGRDNRRYISCNGPEKAINEDCQNVRMKTAVAEAAVFESLNKIGNLLLEKSKKKRTIGTETSTKDHVRNIEVLENRLKKVSDNRRAQYMKMRAGKITREQYSEIMESDMKKEADIKSQIETEQSYLNKTLNSTRKQQEMERQGDLMIQMSEYDPELVKKVLKTIYIDRDNHVELQFNNEDIFQLI